MKLVAYETWWCDYGRMQAEINDRLTGRWRLDFVDDTCTMFIEIKRKYWFDYWTNENNIIFQQEQSFTNSCNCTPKE